MNARYFTDIGTTRTRNEDSGGVFVNHTGQQMILICDGMGGHNAGDIASQFVADMMKERFEQENYIEFNQAEEWLKNQISDINRLLYQRAHLNDENQGMGTTLVCAILFDDQMIIANIGDSRAYLINDREMRQVTNDHTFVNHLVMAGELTKEEAAVHPQRNIITKVIGTDRRVHPDIFVYETKLYKKAMLSSDGLTDYVNEQKVFELFKQFPDIDDLGPVLIETALQAGVRDNVSFVLCELGGVH